MDKKYQEPPEVTEYFKTGSKNINNVIANHDYTITITYDNGVRKLYDIKQHMDIKYFKCLEDIEKFKKVKHTKKSIFWDDMTDLCGDSCYIYGLTIKSDTENGL